MGLGRRLGCASGRGGLGGRRDLRVGRDLFSQTRVAALGVT
jgi:hypothetical protein